MTNQDEPTQTASRRPQRITIVFIRSAELGSQGHSSGSSLTGRMLDSPELDYLHQCADEVRLLNIRPDVVLHADTVGARLSALAWLGRLAIDTPNGLKTSRALTPTDDCLGVAQFLDEAGICDAHPRKHTVIMAVGHEGALSNLISRFTGRRFRALERSEAVCIHAGVLEDLVTGRAELAWRMPVRALQEGELQGKLTTKLSVTAILAGLNAASLVALAGGERFGCFRTSEWPRLHFPLGLCDPGDWLQVFALLALVLACGLFMGAAYIFDRLSMPEGFRSAASHTDVVPFHKLPKSVRRNLRDGFGETYAYMVAAWKFLVTPAVVLSAAALVTLVWHRESYVIAVVCIGLMLLAVWCYRRLRPGQGVD